MAVEKFKGLLAVFNMTVAGHDYKKRPGKQPKYIVILKHDVNTLTLHADTRALWDQYPENSTVVVEVKQPQAALENFIEPEAEAEEE